MNREENLQRKVTARSIFQGKKKKRRQGISARCTYKKHKTYLWKTPILVLNWNRSYNRRYTLHITCAFRYSPLASGSSRYFLYTNRVILSIESLIRVTRKFIFSIGSEHNAIPASNKNNWIFFCQETLLKACIESIKLLCCRTLHLSESEYVFWYERALAGFLSLLRYLTSLSPVSLIMLYI